MNLDSKPQRRLMAMLRQQPGGITVDHLAERLAVSRNAVRQHLTTLERDGFVLRGATRPTGGRPEQLYQLSDKGLEQFPRRYSWFADLLIQTVKRSTGTAGLRKAMTEMGQAAAAQIGPANASDSLEGRVKNLAKVMTELGYEAEASKDRRQPTIEACNCLYHHVAAAHPEVCEFDLALLRGVTGAEVEHDECMVRGGTVCRFRFKARASS
ncbi:MAG: HTH domain-containing protein [Rhodospirillales bacterium]